MDISYLNENSHHNSLVPDVKIFSLNNSLTSFNTRVNNGEHSSTDIFFHSPFKLLHSSSTFLVFFSLALLFSNFLTFPKGFMPGFSVGHSITVTSSTERNVLTSSTERNVLTDIAMWHGALCCINRDGWLIAVLKWSKTCFFNISLYTLAFILPYSLTRGPTPAAEIMLNTNIFPPSILTLLLIN